jgi:Ser/Thr protein kinase RdoA (MazF antagonist)
VNRVCHAFGLGTASAPPVPLTGGSSAARWRLDTDRGRWTVKATDPPADWLRRQMRVSGALELAAYDAGVAMPRPVVPRVAGAIGLWAPVGGQYVRVAAWVDGTPLTEPAPADPAGPASVPASGPASAKADLALAGWLGATIARIERLALPGDPAPEAAYTVHATDDWAGWIDEGVTAGVLDRGAAVAFRAAVADATALVRAALAPAPAFQLAHRDVHRRNVLSTATGLVLLDFDYAGPEVPWWEFVHHTFDLADPPRPDLVGAALAAYIDAGGRPGPADPSAFAGLLRAALESAAYNLWLAVGHRPASADRQAMAVAAVREIAAGLPATLNSLDAWTRLLR